MVEDQQSFISCEELSALLPLGTTKLLNATVNLSPTDPDPFIEHQRGHIPSAQFLDLLLCRDLNSPYPHMMPSLQHFTDIMTVLGIEKDDNVVVYDCR